MRTEPRAQLHKPVKKFFLLILGCTCTQCTPPAYATARDRSFVRAKYFTTWAAYVRVSLCLSSFIVDDRSLFLSLYLQQSLRPSACLSVFNIVVIVVVIIIHHSTCPRVCVI